MENKEIRNKVVTCLKDVSRILFDYKQPAGSYVMMCLNEETGDVYNKIVLPEEKGTYDSPDRLVWSGTIIGTAIDDEMIEPQRLLDFYNAQMTAEEKETETKAYKEYSKEFNDMYGNEFDDILDKDSPSNETYFIRCNYKDLVEKAEEHFLNDVAEKWYNQESEILESIFENSYI